MSVMVRKAVMGNIETIKGQLSSGSGLSVDSVEKRLQTEKDSMVRVLLQEKLDRLKKSTKEPKDYQKYTNELKEIQKHLEAALAMMNTVPFYVTSARAPKGTGKAAAKRTKK